MNYNDPKSHKEQLLRSWQTLVKTASELRGARQSLVVWVARDTAPTGTGVAKRYPTVRAFSPEEIHSLEKAWLEAQNHFSGASRAYFTHVSEANAKGPRIAIHRLGPRPTSDERHEQTAAWDAAAEAIVADDFLSAAEQPSWMTPGRKHLAARRERKALRLMGKPDPIPELPSLEDLAVQATSLHRAVVQSAKNKDPLDQQMALMQSARQAKDELDEGLRTVEIYVALADHIALPHVEDVGEPTESAEFLALYVPALAEYIQALRIVGQEKVEATFQGGRHDWGLLKHIDNRFAVKAETIRSSQAKFACWHYSIEELFLYGQFMGDDHVIDQLEAEARSLTSSHLSEGLSPPDLSGRVP